MIFRNCFCRHGITFNIFLVFVVVALLKGSAVATELGQVAVTCDGRSENQIDKPGAGKPNRNPSVCDQTPGDAHPTESVTFRKQDDGVDVWVGKQRVAEFVHTEDPVGRPFISNLHTLDGIKVTRNYPVSEEDQQDHPHHQGLFHTFSQVNGIDYWHMKGVTRHRRFLIEPTTGSDSSFATESVYLDRDGKTPLLKEVIVYSFYVTKIGLLITVNATIEAEAEQVVLGSKEEGGFAVRMSSDLRVESGGKMVDNQQRRGGKEIWGKTARWVDNSGRKENRWVGVTILTHPEGWGSYYWHARDYGLVTANPLGPLNKAPDRSLNKGETLNFKYGVLVHSNEDSDEYSPTQAQVEYERLATP
ncbi:MAG: PmoA family protein [Pirellulaceae bacterium]|nr:PmoA family protein [Pirellulaceae bacterium]